MRFRDWISDVCSSDLRRLAPRLSMRPICPDSRERKLNGAESGRSAAPRFRLLTAAMIKRLACLLPALLLPVLAAACAPVPPPEAGPASLQVTATAIPHVREGVG